MTQKQIMYFEKAYATRNIATAAEELFVSRSVVSRAIQELEEEFQIALFDRSKSGIVPTDAGIMLRSMMTEISGCYKVLTEHFKRLNNQEAQRVLRIGLTPTNCRVISRILFGEFQDAYPDVKIQVTERQQSCLTEMLTSGQADLLISPGKMNEFSTFETIDLCDVRIVLGVAESDPIASKKELSVMDILDKPLGYLGVPIPSVEYTINSCFSVLKKQPNVVIRSSAVELLRELTQQGRICVILPDNMLFDWPGVVGIRMDFLDKISTHRIVWSKAVPLNSAAQEFIAFMKKRIPLNPRGSYRNLDLERSACNGV